MARILTIIALALMLICQVLPTSAKASHRGLQPSEASEARPTVRLFGISRGGRSHSRRSSRRRQKSIKPVRRSRYSTRRRTSIVRKPAKRVTRGSFRAGKPIVRRPVKPVTRRPIRSRASIRRTSLKSIKHAPRKPITSIKTRRARRGSSRPNKPIIRKPARPVFGRPVKHAAPTKRVHRGKIRPRVPKTRTPSTRAPSRPIARRGSRGTRRSTRARVPITRNSISGPHPASKVKRTPNGSRHISRRHSPSAPKKTLNTRLKTVDGIVSDAGTAHTIAESGFKLGQRITGKGEKKSSSNTGRKRTTFLERGAKVVDAKGKIDKVSEIGKRVVSPFLSDEQKNAIRKRKQDFGKSRAGRAIKKVEPVITTVAIVHGTTTLAHKVAPKKVVKRVRRVYRKFRKKTIKKISKSKPVRKLKQVKKSGTRSLRRAKTRAQAKLNSAKGKKQKAQKKAKAKLTQTKHTVKQGAKTAAKAALNVGKRFVPVVGQVLTAYDVGKFAYKHGGKAFDKYASDETKRKVGVATQYVKDKAAAIKGRLVNPKTSTGRRRRRRSRTTSSSSANRSNIQSTTTKKVHPRAQRRNRNRKPRN